MESAGLELAQVRREAMAELIRNDPKQALELAAPERVRRALPASIRDLLEERVSGRGSLEVLAILAGQGLVAALQRPYVALIQGIDRPGVLARVALASSSVLVVANLALIPDRVPGTRLRFGWDAIIGLIPGAGDILTALLARKDTGEGTVVDVALIDSLGEWMGYAAYYTEYGGTQPPRTGASHATIAPYGPYRTCDGTIIIAVQGQVMPLMQGPATEEQLREALTQVFGALAQQGMLPPGHPGTVDGDPSAVPEDEPGGEPAPRPEADPVDAQAQEALERGDFEAAAAVFEKAVEADPKNGDLRAKLAQIRLIGRLQDVDGPAVRQAAADDPADVDAQITVADIDMYGGKFEDAFDRLIQTVKQTSDEDRDRARAHLLSLFELLPAGDPRVNAARRKLTSALF